MTDLIFPELYQMFRYKGHSPAAIVVQCKLEDTQKLYREQSADDLLFYN